MSSNDLYNEIEETERRLTRKPAAVEDGLSKAFELPAAASKWDDPTSVLRDPTVNREAGSVVGTIAPDYSGFDDLEKGIRGLKPRDTSTADLVSMGLSAGIGALTGQFGTAAKVAGNYGMDRFNRAEKREDDFEKQIQAIKLARANKLAAGRKGVKIGGGVSNADDPTKNRFLGPDGYLHTPTRKREDNTWAQLEDDPVYDKPSAQIRKIDTPDGGSRDTLIDRNRMTSIGSRNAEVKLVKNEKGETIPVNTRTLLSQGLPEGFNETNIGLNPEAKKDYLDRVNKKNMDPTLRAVEKSDNGIRSALDLIRSDTPLTDTAVIKYISREMEGGNRSTDADFKAVDEVHRGLYEKLNKSLTNLDTGGLTLTGRKEAETLLVAMLNNNKRFYDRKINRANTELHGILRDQMRPDLEFKTLEPYRGIDQSKNNLKNIETAKDFTYSKDVVRPMLDYNKKPILQDGKPVMWKYVVDKDKNGNEVLIPKERVYE